MPLVSEATDSACLQPSMLLQDAIRHCRPHLRCLGRFSVIPLLAHRSFVTSTRLLDWVELVQHQLHGR